MAIGKKHRIVAKTLVASRRPHQRAIDAALKLFEVTVRPGNAQRRYKVRPAVLRCNRTPGLQLMVESFHCGPKISGRTGPSGRVDTGRTAQSIDREPGVIGKRRHGRGAGGRLSLYTSIFPKARARLVGLFETEVAGGDRIDAERFKQPPHFPQFAGIVGGNDQPSNNSAMSMRARQGHITASFWSSMSLPTPLRARANSSSSWASVNGAFSAVVWISTMPPLPVRTKFASVSAPESSA